MIIGVLSDTHRNLRAVDRAFRFFVTHDVKLVFHLGDVCSDIIGKDIEYDMTVICVAGNVDGAADYPHEAVVPVDGVNFFLTHGHALGVSYSLAELVAKAREKDCQVALYGHTHLPFNARENGILVINPGSAAQPRGDSKAAVALIDTNGGKPLAQVHWL